MVFKNTKDYDAIHLNDAVEISDLPQILDKETFKIKINGKDIEGQQTLSPRQIDLLIEGGLINWVRRDLKKKRNK
ncbi:MAG: hypothetical protein ACRCXC_08655 [Legionella sp.]